MRRKNRLNEIPEWKVIRRVLFDRAGLNRNQLLELGVTSGDSLDVVELVMAIEERYHVKIRLSE